MKPKQAILLPLALVAAPALAQSDDIEIAVEKDYDVHLRALFHHFHANPELSGLEVKTAARMAQELRALGAEVTEGVGGTGVVGILRNGKGPLIMLRADMDGLPLREETGLPYASTATQTLPDGTEVPVMHACGHDVHITSMIGTARQLAAMGDRWSGTLMFVVQPAEEGVTGARAMLADGLYERFGKPDYALAFHIGSADRTGLIQASEGATFASGDSLKITVRGVGTHDAQPHMGRDPIYIASQIVVALQSIVSREIDPLAPAVVSVGVFRAGTRNNIIPDSAELELTVRSQDEATRAVLISAIERIATGVARTHGVPADRLPIVERTGRVAVTANDPALARRLNAVMIETFGAEKFLALASTDGK